MSNCKNKNCGCQKYLTTPMSSLPECSNEQPCAYITDAQCVVYTGEDIENDNEEVIVTEGDSLATILNSILTILLNTEGGFSIPNLPVYADNAAAIAGGLTVNTVYKTATGELRIVV
jgi:hypothetical protein